MVSKKGPTHVGVPSTVFKDNSSTDTTSTKTEDMKIIDDLSNLDFASMIADYVIVPQQSQQRNRCDPDKLLFKMEDVLAVSHPLARLMRMILFDNRVTESMFNERHKQYAEDAGYLSIQINYHRNNIKKAMDKDAISFRTFETVISLIMKFNIKDIKMDLLESTGKIKRYGLLDILFFADKYYKNPKDDSPLCRLVNDEYSQIKKD